MKEICQELLNDKIIIMKTWIENPTNNYVTVELEKMADGLIWQYNYYFHNSKIDQIKAFFRDDIDPEELDLSYENWDYQLKSKENDIHIEVYANLVDLSHLFSYDGIHYCLEYKNYIFI